MNEYLSLYTTGDEDTGYGPGGAAGSEQPCYGATSPEAGKALPKASEAGSPESNAASELPVAQAMLGMAK